MKYINHLALFALFVLILSGCAAIGVPHTNDPAKKIGYAYQLFDKQQRPLPAEKLIREAIDILKTQNNCYGLSEAYRAYGFFFRSAAVEKYHKHYKANGFMEPGATFDNRHEYSIKYFEKAGAIYLENNAYDKLTNIYLNMAFTYEFAKNNAKACEFYKKSLSSNKKYDELNPDSTMNLPEGFSSYGEYVRKHMERVKC